MSRSGYTDDCENLNLYRGNVERCLKGKKGQAVLRELRDALLAMPEKKIVAHAFACESGVCAMGALAERRLINQTGDATMARSAVIEMGELHHLNEDESRCDSPSEATAKLLKIPKYLAREVAFENDDMDGMGFNLSDNPEDRYKRMLSWVNDQIVETA